MDVKVINTHTCFPLLYTINFKRKYILVSLRAYYFCQNNPPDHFYIIPSVLA